MKKIVLFLICSVFLYGAGLQVATPQVDLVECKNAKELKFVEAYPAQFTIKIPLDIEPIPEGSVFEIRYTSGVKSFNMTSQQKVNCYIDSKNKDISYYQEKLIEEGQKIIVLKFNNILSNKANRIESYNCFLHWGIEGGGYRPASAFSNTGQSGRFKINGSF